MQRPLWISALTALALAAAIDGCASASKPAPVTYAPTTYSATAAVRHCPLGVDGARVAVTDTPEGVDLTFTTERDASELRRRVRASAELHGPGMHQGLGHGGAHGLGHAHGLRLSQLPPVKASVVDTDSGSRLQLAALDPARVGELRADVHDRLGRMQLGDCP